MKITTIITLALAAFLLAGCILQTGKEGANAASALETKSQSAIKNEPTMENKSANAANSGATPANKSTSPLKNGTATAGSTPANENTPYLKNETAQSSGATPASYSGNDSVPISQPQESQPPKETEESPSFIKIAYFYSKICPFSPNATIYMDFLEEKYSASTMRYEIYYNLTNFNLLKEYAAEYGLRPDEFVVPIAFINSSYFAGPDIYSGLEEKIQNLAKEAKK